MTDQEAFNELVDARLRLSEAQGAIADGRRDVAISCLVELSLKLEDLILNLGRRRDG